MSEVTSNRTSNEYLWQWGKNTENHQVKMVTRRKYDVISITVSLPTMHTSVR